MNIFQPGDVIIAFAAGARKDKVRPGIVVCSEKYLSERPDVVFALVTSQVEKADTDFDCSPFDWREAGLKEPSTVRSYFYTTEQSMAHRVGRLSDADWHEVQTRLRLALEL